MLLNSGNTENADYKVVPDMYYVEAASSAGLLLEDKTLMPV